MVLVNVLNTLCKLYIFFYWFYIFIYFSLCSTSFSAGGYIDDVRALTGWITGGSFNIKSVTMLTEGVCAPEVLFEIIHELMVAKAQHSYLHVLTKAPLYAEVAAMLMNRMNFDYEGRRQYLRVGDEMYDVMVCRTNHVVLGFMADK